MMKLSMAVCVVQRYCGKNRDAVVGIFGKLF